MIVDLVVVAACLVVIWLASDRLVGALAQLATDFRIPQSVAGATLAAIGSSAPELLTSSFAIGWAGSTVRAGGTNLGQGDLGVAAILGSGLFNLCMMIGVAAAIRPLEVNRRVLWRDGAFYLGAVALTLWFVIDRQLVWWEAVLWLLLYGVYLAVLLVDVWRHPEETASEGELQPLEAVLTLAGGLLLVAVACGFLVRHTMGLATDIGLPASLVSLLVLAVGTSLPDLITSLQAARQGNTSLALSNAIGTNCFDLCVALGLPVLAYNLIVGDFPLGVMPAGMTDYPAWFAGDLLLITTGVLALTLLATLLFIGGRYSVERWQATCLIAIYPLFLLVVYAVWSDRLGLLSRNEPLWSHPACAALLGIMSCAVGFLLLVALSRWLLERGGKIGAVARHVLEESLRARAALIPLLMLLALLPIIPLLLDASQPVRFRIQSTLSYALTLSSVLLSLMTLVLASSALAGEIAGRQIYGIVTKPIQSWTYLLGRWVGVMWLNAILLVVVFLATVVLSEMLANQRPRDDRDRRAVRAEVLIARSASRPQIPQQIDERIAQQTSEAVARAREDGELVDVGEVRERIEQRELIAWRSLGPGQRRTYRFSGLGPAKRVRRLGRVAVEMANVRDGPSMQANVVAELPGGTPLVIEEERDGWLQLDDGRWISSNLVIATAAQVQLRLRVTAASHVPGNELKLLVFVGRQPSRLPVGLDAIQTFPLNARMIRNDGTLDITFVNSDPTDPDAPRPSISFEGRDGLEVLYPSGDFASNLARALLIIWIKLGFLAMLALVAAIYLTFPVACLLGLVTLFVLSVSSFIIDSEQLGAAVSASSGETVGGFASALAELTQVYGRVDPVDPLVDGRLIGWGAVGHTALLIGLLWTGLIYLAGVVIFRVREMARVQV